MSHSICFPPRKVTAKVYVTKMASQKKVPQITTTNKNTTDPIPSTAYRAR